MKQATPCTYYELDCPHCKDVLILCPPDGHPEYLECCCTCGCVFIVPADELPSSPPDWVTRSALVVASAIGSMVLLTLGLGGFFLLAMLAE